MENTGDKSLKIEGFSEVQVEDKIKSKLFSGQMSDVLFTKKECLFFSWSKFNCFWLHK